MPNEQTDARRGRTLAEILVTLAVSGVLFALLAAAFIGHDRLVAGSTAIAEMRSQLRQAQQILPALLRPVASGDLYAVYDTLADFGYPIASGVACLASGTSQVTLAPDSIANGQRFASRTHSPRSGDVAHVFDPGPLATATDDRWYTATVAALAAMPNGCTGSPLIDSVADATHRARVVSLTAWSGGVTPPSIPAGAIILFTRRIRARLYGSGGKDYLGVSDFDPVRAGWSVVQPVSGPYLNRPGSPGVQLRLLDSSGAAIASGLAPVAVASLEIHVRGQTAAPVRITGMRGGLRAESLSVHAALRNR